MTFKRGRKLIFVGVDIELMDNGTVKLSMDEFVNECAEVYKSDVKSKAATPTKGDLFDEDIGILAQALDEEEAERFHHTTAKLLYLSKRVRVDIDLAILFLCMRVTAPTKGKLFLSC